MVSARNGPAKRVTVWVLRKLTRGGVQESRRGIAQGSGFKIRIRHAQRIQGLELYRPKHTNAAPGFSAVFKTIPVGPSVWKRPGPQAVRDGSRRHSDEISRLSHLFPNASVLRDEAATREAFVESSKISSFLHIASHAIFRQDNPMFSSFKLADGWFTAFDLFSMSCQTNLVTLSGCQSGMSEVTGSADLLGLMRGFCMPAPGPLLLSLWNVNDESTAAASTRRPAAAAPSTSMPML